MHLKYLIVLMATKIYKTWPLISINIMQLLEDYASRY